MTKECKAVIWECEEADDWDMCWEEYMEQYTDPESRVFEFLRLECEWGNLQKVAAKKCQGLGFHIKRNPIAFGECVRDWMLELSR
jgi:hypothetical protein